MKQLLAIFLLPTLLLAASDPKAIKAAASASHAVYEDTQTHPFGVIHTHENKILGNRLIAFHDVSTKTAYIAIRGTQKIQTWIANLYVGSINNPLGVLLPNSWQKLLNKTLNKTQNLAKIWFLMAFQDLKAASEKLISRSKDTRFVFTGHSYGGLMANLLMQDFYHRYPNLDFSCHTFGAPGAREVRKDALELPDLPEQALAKVFNHVRETDPIGKINTHDGRVLYYQPALRFQGLTDGHAMTYFLEDLENGMKPIN